MLRCRMTRLPSFIAVSLTLCASAFAHDTWLSPSTYSANTGQPITFDLTSGMEFPTLDAAVKPERVAKAGFRLGSESGELKGFAAAPNALRFEHSFSTAGIATLWLQLAAKEIELSDDDVAHYLEEARAPEEVQRAWAAQKGREKWKELYTKCAKTCVIIGDAANSFSWKQPVGMALEFVPVTSPAEIRVNASAKFKLLRNGKPLGNAAVALHSEADAGPRFEQTDAEGVVTFQIGKAGPTMLATVHLRPPSAGKPWQSEFSTLTFDVKADDGSGR